MGACHDRKTDHINIFLDSDIDDLVNGSVKAGIYDLHASFLKRLPATTLAPLSCPSRPGFAIKTFTVFLFSIIFLPRIMSASLAMLHALCRFISLSAQDP